MNTNVDVELFSVLSVRDLTESTYILRFARKGMAFKPGQHLVVGIPGSGEYREYSIYSGINEDFLEILIKEVDDGLVSKDTSVRHCERIPQSPLSTHAAPPPPQNASRA